MQQLTQQLKSGKMTILEVPIPAVNKGQILIRNHYSVISPGTEGNTVADARKGYIAKAKTRGKEVKQVIKLAKTIGILPTYQITMNKLESPSSLGYSCAGEVIAVGSNVEKFKVGDYVGCGGQGACHAEIVSVFENLCVKVPKGVNIKHAAFSTIASIAIQGIRQSKLSFGENCVIIGLGLIGQLTIQILNAAGIKTIGIDIIDQQVEMAESNGADLSLHRDQNNLEEIIEDFTDGYGADAVIITAASKSNDPVDLAGALCRKKGIVVIVGKVPTNFNRIHYYSKELELRMSTSYGPGRYDPEYEEKGNDYPIGYVRWTEQRNMEAYISMLSKHKINIDGLITHEFSLHNAPDAYKMILNKSEPFTGILLKYNVDKNVKKDIILKDRVFPQEEINVGFIGAGSFAQSTLLPRAKGLCNFVGIATARGNNSKYVADKYNFNYCSSSADHLISDKNINTIFITTRHDLHTKYVIDSIKKNKNVFVEKPLALDFNSLEEVKEAYESDNYSSIFMVGYNRRFSPHILEIKKRFLESQPKLINYRINAGFIQKTHWLHDRDIGGGRIIGEVCHFVDLCLFIAGSKIKTLSAICIDEPNNLMDSLVVNLSFENGSIASISYFSNGSSALPKENLEVHCNGETIVIKDFKVMEKCNNKIKVVRKRKQDKGHKRELISFFHSIKNGIEPPIAFDDIYHSTFATLKINESIKQNCTVTVDNYT